MMKTFADRCTATDPATKIALQILTLSLPIEPVVDQKNGVLIELVSITQMLHMFKVNVSCVSKDGEPSVTGILRNERIHNFPF